MRGRAGPSRQGHATLRCWLTSRHTWTDSSIHLGTGSHAGPQLESEQIQVQPGVGPAGSLAKITRAPRQARVAEAWPLPIGNMARQRMPWMRTRRMPRGQEGTLCLGHISEPDFVTAHTGHPVNVAQHWKADETCGVRDPRRLSHPHFLEAGRPLSALGDLEAFGTRGRAREQGSRPLSLPRLVRRPPGNGSRRSGRLLS